MFDLQQIKGAGFKEVLRQMPAAVMIVEAPSGKIIFRNRRAQQWREQSLSQARATKLEDADDFDIFRPDGRPYGMEDWPLMRSIRDGEEVRDEEFIYPLADGSRLWLRCDSSPIYDDEGRIIAGVLVAHDVTELKWAEEKLRRSEERFRLLVEGVRDYAIFMLDPNGHIETWNEGARRIKGYSQQEILGQHFSIFYPPEAIELGKPERELKEAEVQGIYEEDGWRVRKDGGTFWASVLITALRDEAGQLRGFSKVTRDITERKEAEEALRESSRRTENVLESITDEFVALEREWRYTYVNERALDVIRRAKGEELTREQLLGKNIWEIYPEAVSTVFYQKYHEAMREQKSVEFEAYSPASDRWVEVHTYPSEEGLSVYGHDITERKGAEEQRAYHAYLLENIHDAVIGTDEHLVVTAWNKGAEQMYGWRADEVLGRNLWEAVPSDLSEEQRAEALRELSERGRFRTEVFTYGKESTPVYVEGITIALRGEQGQITGYVNIRRDITVRKEAEKEIETRVRQQAAVAELGLTALAENDLQLLMDEAVALVARTLDAEYAKIVELLPGGEELLLRAGVGWREGLVGETKETSGLGSQAGYTLLVSEPVILEDLSTETRFRPSWLVREHGAMSGMSVVIQGRDGPFGVLSAYTREQGTFSEDDVDFLQAIANVLATAIEREEAEERVEEGREAERSRISRDIHDEALQDLTDALMQIQQILNLSEDSQQTLRLARLLATLDRIGPQLRGAIYDLRLEGEKKKLFPELLESLVKLHRGMAPECDIGLEVHDGVLSEPLGQTGRQLLRILGEALTNARRHSGAIHVRVGVGITEEKLWAEVEDDGRGFDAAEASEHALSAGGGLGIRGMRERARALGGDLKIESDPERGTRVRFELVLQRELEEADQEEVHILLVDDHATVRDALASTFEEEEGFEIVGEAGSMAEARRILAQESVDMAVIDLGLPDGYGADLINELREKNPQAQALVLSASLDRANIARAVERGAGGALNKTVHLDEVVQAVRRLRAGETLMPLEEVVELLRFAGSEREEEHEASQAIASLTPREKEVLQALALGLDSRQIAERLHISLRTERNHMSSILAKLGVHSQLQALVFALRHNVVELH